MKLTATLLALALLTIGGFRAFAEPQTQTPPVAVANPPWAASENNVVGEWSWGAGSDDTWNAHFNADHTVTAFFEGFVGMGPITSTWTLKNNHVMVDEAPFIKYFGSGLSFRNYPTVASRTYPIHPNFGSDLQVIRYQGSIVLYSTAMEDKVQKYGPASFFCYWQYEHTKKGNTLPAAAIKLDKHVQEMLKQEQDKKR